MFTFNPEMAVQDDDEATDDIVYRGDSDVRKISVVNFLLCFPALSCTCFDSQEEQDEVVARAIDESLFLEEEVDATGTISTSADRHGATSSLPAHAGGDAPGTSRDVLVDDVPVDADLFDEDEEENEENGQGDDDASDTPSQ